MSISANYKINTTANQLRQLDKGDETNETFAGMKTGGLAILPL